MYRNIAQFEKKKGDKNMLYFYCCDVLVGQQTIARVDGVYSESQKVETEKQFSCLRGKIEKRVFGQILPQVEGLRMENMALLFRAFNPL